MFLGLYLYRKSLKTLDGFELQKLETMRATAKDIVLLRLLLPIAVDVLVAVISSFDADDQCHKQILA